MTLACFSIVTVYLSIYLCNSITFKIDGNNKSAPSIPDEYISVTIGVLTDEKANTFPFESKELNTLAQGLSPAYMRFGGTSADQLVYVMNGSISSSSNSLSLTTNISYPLNLTTFGLIADFAERNNWKLVFGLNEQQRILTNNVNEWNSTNSKQLLLAIKNSKKQNNNNPYVYAFELGNEPNLYNDQKDKSNEYVVVSPQQEAKDFHTLYNLIQNEFNDSSNNNYFIPKLWGNDNADRANRKYQQQWAQSVSLMNNSNEIDAMTWHHYYGGSANFNLSDYYSVNVLDTFIVVLQNVTNISYLYFGKDNPIVIGETASSSGGGCKNITNTYVDGFMWLDKLGLSSIYGMNAVCRQVFYHSNYALVNPNPDKSNKGNLIVTPDYWSSYLFKNLVGNKVVYVNGQFDYGRYLRVYSFCTRIKDKGSVFNYSKGSITVMILNLYNSTQVFNIDIIGINNNNIDDMSYDEFHLTPNGIITSSDILLNGNIIKMINATTFPKFLPVNSKFNSSINLTALSYAFVVVLNANAPVCM